MLLLTSLAGAYGQTVWHVPDDPGAATVAQALGSAAAGDTILISPGIYDERDLLLDSPVVLRGSTGDPVDVVIDAQSQSRVLSCLDIDAGARLESLTLIGGRATGGDPAGLGGAILMLRASPTITRCRFENNYGDYGGAFYLRDQSSPQISDCVFVSNHTASMGGAIFCHQYSSPHILRCTFEDNDAVGAGGGIYIAMYSSPRIESCTFVTNVADFGGALSGYFAGAEMVTHCLIAENRGHGACDAAFLFTPVACTDIFGNIGGDWTDPLVHQLGQDGNFSADPLFCRQLGPLSYWQIAAISPCAPLQNPECGLVGAWNVGCEAGVGVPEVPVPTAVLHPCAPNPFNASTLIRFDLARPGRAGLRLYDLGGRLVLEVFDGPLPAGPHQRVWSGTDSAGHAVASGIYICRLVFEDTIYHQLVTMVK